MCSQLFCPICYQLQLDWVFEGPALGWPGEEQPNKKKESEKRKEDSENTGKWKHRGQEIKNRSSLDWNM